MAAPISPGDWVERIPCKPGACAPVATIGEVPVIGKIYQVRDLAWRLTPEGRKWQGLRLVGIVMAIPGCADAFAQVEAFRPIYRPRDELIEALKAPPQRAPIREPEAA